MPVDQEPMIIGQDFFQHTHNFLKGLREDSPVRRVRLREGQSCWVITRYEDVQALQSDPRISHDLDRLLEAGWAAYPDQGDDDASDPYRGPGWIYRHLLFADPPDHTRLRKLANKSFTTPAVDRLEPRIARYADELLGKLGGEEPVDLMAAFAVPLPVFAISEVLGIPEEDRPNFWGWSNVINGTSEGQDIGGALRTAAEYLGDLAARKKANPGPDLLSQMVEAHEDGDGLSHQELISMALFMLLAGHDTTVSLITNGTLAFLEHPDQLALVHSDPSLLGNAIEEILRYDGPVNLSPGIVTTEPIELSGVRIPAGEILRVSRAAANRDPRQFADPDRFDITRDVRGHAGFGYGIHYCMGAPLARMEGRVALSKLFRRFPGLRLAAEPAQLTYRISVLFHGLESFPVYLS
jgi:cytochrome P450